METHDVEAYFAEGSGSLQAWAPESVPQKNGAAKQKEELQVLLLQVFKTQQRQWKAQEDLQAHMAPLAEHVYA